MPEITVEELCVSLRADMAALTQLRSSSDAHRVFDDMERRVTGCMSDGVLPRESAPVLHCLLSDKGMSENGREANASSHHGEGLLVFASGICESVRVCGADMQEARLLRRTMTFLSFTVNTLCESFSSTQAEVILRLALEVFLLFHRLEKHTETQSESLNVVTNVLRRCGNRPTLAQSELEGILQACMQVVESRTVLVGQRVKSAAIQLLGCFCVTYTDFMSPHAARVLRLMLSAVGGRVTTDKKNRDNNNNNNNNNNSSNNNNNNDARRNGNNLIIGDNEKGEEEEKALGVLLVVEQQLVAEGFLLAMADYTTVFPLTFYGSDHRIVVMIHQLVKSSIHLVGNSKNYRLCKAALLLLKRGACQLKECLMNDAEEYYDILRHLWNHKNVGLRRTAYSATSGFLQALSIVWGGARQCREPVSLLRFIYNNIERTLRNGRGSTSSELSFAVMGLGYISRPLGQLLGLDFLTRVFHELTNTCELLLAPAVGPPREVVRLLPFFMTSLALMLIELPPVVYELPRMVGMMIGTALHVYPQELCGEGVRIATGTALLKLLVAIHHRGGVRYTVACFVQQLLTVVCHRTLLSSSSSLLLLSAVMAMPTAKEEELNALPKMSSSHTEYVNLWKLLLSTAHSVVDWGYPWSECVSDILLENLRLTLDRELVLAECEMLRRLDLSLLGEDNNGNHNNTSDLGGANIYIQVLCEEGYVRQPRNLNDCATLFHFIPFFVCTIDITLGSRINSNKKHAVWSTEDAALSLIEKLVTLSRDNAHVSGFYTCLYAILQTARGEAISLAHAEVFLRHFAITCSHRLTMYTGESLLQWALCMVSLGEWGFVESREMMMCAVEVVLNNSKDTAAVATALAVLTSSTDRISSSSVAACGDIVQQSTMQDLVCNPKATSFTQNDMQIDVGHRQGFLCTRMLKPHPCSHCVDGRRHCSHWGKGSSTHLHLLMGDTTLSLSLDVLIPRILLLSHCRESPHVRIAACQLLYIVVYWLITHAAEDWYDRVFGTILRLSAGVDVSIRDASRMLLLQTVKWFSQHDVDCSGAELVECVLWRGLTLACGASVRQTALEALMVSVEWIVKHTTNDRNNSVHYHPCHHQRQKGQTEGEEKFSAQVRESRLGRVVWYICVLLRDSSLCGRLGGVSVLCRVLYLLRDTMAIAPFVILLMDALLQAFAAVRAWDGDLCLAEKLRECVMRLTVYLAQNRDALAHLWREACCADSNQGLLEQLVVHAYREGRSAANTMALLKLLMAFYQCNHGNSGSSNNDSKNCLDDNMTVVESEGMCGMSLAERADCGLQLYDQLTRLGLQRPVRKRLRDESLSRGVENTFPHRVLHHVRQYLQTVHSGNNNTNDKRRFNDDAERLLSIVHHLVRLLRNAAEAALCLSICGDSLLHVTLSLLLDPAELGIPTDIYRCKPHLCLGDLIVALWNAIQHDPHRRRTFLASLHAHISSALLSPQPSAVLLLLPEFFYASPITATNRLRAVVVLVGLGLSEELLPHFDLQNMLAALSVLVRDDDVAGCQWGAAFCHTLLLLLIAGGIELAEILAGIERHDAQYHTASQRMHSGLLEASLREGWRDESEGSSRNTFPLLSRLFVQLCRLCGELLRKGGQDALESIPVVALRGILQDLQYRVGRKAIATGLKRETLDTPITVLLLEGIAPLMEIVRESSAVLEFLLEVHSYYLRLSRIDNTNTVLMRYQEKLLEDISRAVGGERWTMGLHTLLTRRIAVQLFVSGVNTLCDAVTLAALHKWPLRRYLLLTAQLLIHTINDELSLDWKDLCCSGSLSGENQMLIVSAIVKLAKCTAVYNGELLFLLLPLLQQTDLPLYDAITTAVHDVLQQLGSDELGKLCHRSFEMHLEGGFPQLAGLALTYCILLPCLYSLPHKLQINFFLQYIVSLVRETSISLHTAGSLHRQTRAFIILEAMYRIVEAADLRGCIYAAFVGECVTNKDDRSGGNHSTGRELTVRVIKTCTTAQTVEFPPELSYSASSSVGNTDDVRNSRGVMMYRQAAFRCLAALLTATQDQEKVFIRLLLDSQNHHVWNGLVDVSRKHQFPVEAKFPQMTQQLAKVCGDWEMNTCSASQTRVCKNLHTLQVSNRLSWLFFPAGPTDHSCLTSQMLHGCNYKSEKYKASLGNQCDSSDTDKSASLSDLVYLDDIWTSTCSGALLSVVDFMLLRFGTTTTTTTSSGSSSSSGWLNEIVRLLCEATIHSNMKLVVVRIVQFRASYFAPVANTLRDALVDLICSPDVGSCALHYVVYDVLLLLLQWRKTHAMEFTAGCAIRLMKFLLSATPHPETCVMERNMELVELFWHYTRELQPVHDTELLLLLRGNPIMAKCGVHICGLVVNSGVLLSSLAPAADVTPALSSSSSCELYTSLVSLLEKTEDVVLSTAVAELIGLELCKLKKSDSCNTEAVVVVVVALREITRRTLLRRLSSRGRTQALWALRGLVEHDTTMLEDIPYTTLFTDYRCLAVGEQLVLLEVMSKEATRWYQQEHEEREEGQKKWISHVYSTLQGVFSNCLNSVVEVVRIALYQLLVLLLPFMTTGSLTNELEGIVVNFLSADAWEAMCAGEETRVVFFTLAIHTHKTHQSSCVLDTIVRGVKDESLRVQDMVLAYLSMHVLPSHTDSRLMSLLEIMVPQTSDFAWSKYASVLLLLSLRSRSHDQCGNTSRNKSPRGRTDHTTAPLLEFPLVFSVCADNPEAKGGLFPSLNNLTPQVAPSVGFLSVCGSISSPKRAHIDKRNNDSKRNSLQLVPPSMRLGQRTIFNATPVPPFVSLFDSPVPPRKDSAAVHANGGDTSDAHVGLPRNAQTSNAGFSTSTVTESQRSREDKEVSGESLTPVFIFPDSHGSDVAEFQMPLTSFILPLQILCLHDEELARCCIKAFKERVGGLDLEREQPQE